MLGGLGIPLSDDEYERLVDEGFIQFDDNEEVVDDTDEMTKLRKAYRLWWGEDENLPRHYLVDKMRFTSSANWDNRIVTYDITQQAFEDMAAAKKTLSLSREGQIVMCLGYF
jgi:hypothetical protein